MGHSIKLVLRVLAVDTAIALIPPFLLLAVLKNVTAARLLQSFGYSLIYAHCIGTLAFITVPRIWVASEKISLWARWTIRAGVMFAATTSGSLIACVVFMALRWIPPEMYWTEFRGSLKMATFITVFASVVISMYENFHARLEETRLQLRTQELERERALKLATEAQLASLESRIHPHFLFNALNSISSLIPEDPKRAERLVEQMAALLRFSLDADHAGLVPLDREMKIVSDYLEIEQARFGDRLRFHIDDCRGCSGAHVPPLAIQTLVENSVKHAVSRNRTGGEILVSLARENGSLRVEVQDEGPEFTLDSAPPGHGLDLLKSRLIALYGRQGGLSLERRGGANRITLSVPQNGGGHASVLSR
jgi:two-component system, LytTR family, sensor histidine kinase AlgZ